MSNGAEVRIQALGGYRIVVDGRDLRLRTRKEALLLLRLALAGDEGVSRDECVGLLWPDSSEARARHSLSEALRGIEMATQLEVVRSPERLSLPATPVSFDIRELDDAIAAGDVNACARLHKGGFLAGWYPPTAEASHWVDAIAAGIATRLERMLRRELAARRQATDSRGVSVAVALLDQLGVATTEDQEAGAEAEQITAWETLRAGESVHSRLPVDREGPFVGRVEEMKILTAELERAMKGEVRVVLVSGEPGIGKTRTCQRLARLAALRGARLFLSTCYELEQSVAYGAISETLSAAVTPMELAAIRSPFREALGALVPLMPPADSTNDVDRSKISDTRGLMEAVAAIVHAIGATRTCLFHIDDVQWADASSCQVLHYLQRTAAPEAGALYLLSYRTDEVTDNPSATTLIRSCEMGGATTLRLKPMQSADIKRQLAPIATALNERLDDLIDLAQGNPFFARELAMADAQPSKQDGHRLLTDVIRSRAGRLGHNERMLLDTVAVVGAPISLLDLSRLIGESVPTVTRWIPSLIQMRLIKEQGPTVLMAHDLTRHAFYTALPEPVRRSLHGAVGIALENGGSSAFLAHHFSLGGIREKARHYAEIAAATSRKKRAYLEELRWLLLSLENADSAVTAALENVVDRMFALAMYAEASNLLTNRVRNLTPRLRLKADLARLKLQVSSSAEYRQTLNDCDDLFQRAVRIGAANLAMDVLREKMRFSQEAIDIATTLSIADDLATFGESVGDDAIRAHALAISTMKLSSFNPVAGERQLTSLRALLTPELPPDVSQVVQIAEALNDYNQGRMKDAGHRLRGLIVRARATGELADEVRFRTVAVPISMEIGRFSRGQRHAAFVINWSRFVQADWETLMTLTNLATYHWEYGYVDQAKRYAEKTIAAEKNYPMWVLGVHPLAILGLCEMDMGNMKGAYYYRDAVLERLAPPSDWWGDMSQVVMLLVRTAECAGKADDATAWLARALSNPRGAIRIFHWQVELERIRFGMVEEGAMSSLSAIADEAQRGSCRLIVRKAKRLMAEKSPGHR